MRRVLQWLAMLFGSRWPEAEVFRQRREGWVEHHAKPTDDPYPLREPPPPRMILLIRAGHFMERVELDGYSLHELNLSTGSWRSGRLVDRVLSARSRVLARVAVDRAERKKAAQVREEERWQRVVSSEARPPVRPS